jgi:hypothetical protein
VRFKPLNATLIAAACISGILCAQLICRSISWRNALGVLLGRGKLLALVQGTGIYEADVVRVSRELRSRTAGGDSEIINPEMVQLTNTVPTREMPFDQVEAEIRLTLENQDGASLWRNLKRTSCGSKSSSALHLGKGLKFHKLRDCVRARFTSG